jgi:hypothetical protein
MNFIPGYLVSATCAFQLFVPCVLGTMLKVKGNELHGNVCKISWHLLSIPDQKSLQLILQFGETSKCLTAAHCPLDLQTFVEVRKGNVFLKSKGDHFNYIPDLQGNLLILDVTVEGEMNRYGISSTEHSISV